MSLPLISLFVRHEQDVVAARQRARQIAARLGFESQDQTRIATAVSEIARNAFMYGGGGKVEIAVEGRYAPQLLVMRVSDRGPGIRDLDAVLSGRYRSSTGMGLGMVGARRLVDHFEVTSRPGAGATVTLGKLFPRRAPEIGPAGLAALSDALAREAPQGALEEVRQQNQELLRTLDELRERQEDLSRLNAELQDTNRGVLALYAELDEKADTLRRADEMKSRFLSNMSHEFRTPLNSMLALSRLLLEDAERPLTAEQRRQVGYIRQAAEDLTELVNDLLDLAKVEAGKIVIRPAEFDVRDLFAALRGMLRPLLLNDQVNLVFEEPEGVPPMHTDEGKVSQILRNLLSNALKFTERGEIRVSARSAGEGPGGPLIAFSVADTGIGIAPADQQRIFEEFGQLENPVQRRVRGTGLGLPLVRRLATLLGGSVSLDSTPGEGSTFTTVLPARFATEPEPRGDGGLGRRRARPARAGPGPGAGGGGQRPGPAALRALLPRLPLPSGDRAHPAGRAAAHRPDPPGRAGPRHPPRGRGRLGLHRRGAAARRDARAAAGRGLEHRRPGQGTRAGRRRLRDQAGASRLAARHLEPPARPGPGAAGARHRRRRDRPLSRAQPSRGRRRSW